MRTSIQLIHNFPVPVQSISEYRYVKFRYTKGNRYRIVYSNALGEIITEGSGIALTYTRNTLKYGVLQRRFYGNLMEALYTAALWQSLVHETDKYNYWSRWYNKFYVLDTKTGELINCNVIL